MTGYSPAALTALWKTFKQAVPQAELGGIGGDFKSGYHNSVNGNRRRWPGDYSIQRADDLKGDLDAGRAIDLTLRRPADMKKYTQRLIDATLRGDKRMQCCREFFGTVNGTTVTGLDVRDKRWVTSDPSHLWHIHISFYTKFATDHAAAQGVAGVLLGIKGTPPKEKDMTPEQTEKMIAEAMWSAMFGGDHGRFTQKKYGGWVKNQNNGVFDRLVRLEKKVK